MSESTGRITLDQLKAGTGSHSRKEEEVTIEGRGTVLIRAFSKGDARRLRERATNGEEIDQARLEIELMRAGVVDPPLGDFSPEEIEAVFEDWAAPEVDNLLFAIMELNGWTKGFVREEVTRFREGDEVDVPVPSGS